MDKKKLSKRMAFWAGLGFLLACLLGLVIYQPSQAFSLAPESSLEGLAAAPAAPQAQESPEAWPADPTADIPWSGGMSTVVDIQGAFNHAHTVENAQLGISMGGFTLPSQSTWNGMTDGAKAFWLINRERTARGVKQMHGVETNVTSVAQTYANYLLAHNVFSHTADGRDPWQRLNANPTIGACHDFLPVAENLATYLTSGSSIPLPVERAVYDWMYNDSGSGWGHRHAMLYYPYTDNGGPTDREGFLGIGRAHGPYLGWNFGEVIVLNVFDPCASWNYSVVLSKKIYMPMIRK